jgi:hypothetical protein
MKHDSGPVMLLKTRSQSVPSFNPIAAPILKKRNANGPRRLKDNHPDGQTFPVISLGSSKNRRDEEVSKHLKTIEERNAKKLEERYETIDRWKQRYISDSQNFSTKSRPTLHEPFPFMEVSTEPISASPKLPTVSKLALSPAIPDHHEQNRRLEAELIARLQRNKRYYEAKSQEVKKEANCVEQSEAILSAEKKLER